MMIFVKKGGQCERSFSGSLFNDTRTPQLRKRFVMNTNGDFKKRTLFGPPTIPWPLLHCFPMLYVHLSFTCPSRLAIFIWKTRELPGVALVNCAISHIFTIIQIKLLKQSFLFISPCMDAPYVWDHILEGKACIKNPKTCGPSK